jgi:TolA-binding protein
MFRAIGQLVSYDPPPAPSPGAAARPAPPAPEPVPAPAAAEPAPVVAEPQVAEPAKVAPSASAVAAPAAAASASAAFQDTDGDLYRLAHEAHFTSHDYGRALAGWDAYLRAAPGGRLATEARYNRAICLLRLGREAEARRALEPFASGFMGYRQTEARQLLQELSR